MVDLGSWVMSSKLMDNALTRGMVLGLVKSTFYDHFCAGEDADAAAKRVRSVYEATGLKGMLVYGVEHADDAALAMITCTISFGPLKLPNPCQHLT
ncbi:hypothetical protein Bca52824_030057 [Brassica carinata]|uniref:Proline dehydrogenase n=1 Tax=Brassica carinata TaxID=52824 RepID=A0A8X7S872_BRACI|nr:hypothetical protein Bca52824_030057 [Brassica carinata]